MFANEESCVCVFFFYFVVVVVVVFLVGVLPQLLLSTKLIAKHQWKSPEEQPRRASEDAAFRCLFKFCERCVPLIKHRVQL